ncbi:DUF2079 domain-containing protein [Patescibacteria group bacterium]|nr:DUF2079 domain-containing protein [Patescibacteria group bacterium]MBU0964299.1 DUF2079 domain-containing protein [Patescibacteria group bacterium]
MSEQYTIFFIAAIILYCTLMLAGLGAGFIISRFFSNWFDRFLKIRYLTAVRILLLAILVYVIFFSVFSIVRYNLFIPGMYDMGNMEQTVWNTAQGDVLRMTTQFPAFSRLHYHVEPVFLLLAPLYSFWPDGRLLLVIQTVIMALGAIPVFLLARYKFVSSATALCFGLAYLLYPAMHQANIVDFHPLALGSTFILFGFYLALKQKYFWGTSFFLLAVACREEFAVMVFLLGLYFIIIRRQWKFGLILSAPSILWLCLVLYFILPTYSITGSLMQYELYSDLMVADQGLTGSLVKNPGVLISALFQAPRISYVFYLLAPLIMLPIFAPALLFSGAASFFTIILRPELSLLTGVMHNHVSLTAPAFLSAIFGLAWLAKCLAWPLRKILTVSVSVLVTMVLFVVLLQFTPASYGGNIKPWGSVQERQTLDRMISAIPPEASVMASAELGVKIAGRKDFFNISDFGKTQVDYILAADYRSGMCPSWARGSYSCRDRSQEFTDRIQEIFESGEYWLVEKSDGFYLFQKVDR